MIVHCVNVNVFFIKDLKETQIILLLAFNVWKHAKQVNGKVFFLIFYWKKKFIVLLKIISLADRATAYKNPCSSGPPARNLDGELFQCGPFGESRRDKHQGKCPAGYYCHIGDGIETTACCELSSGIFKKPFKKFFNDK